MRSRRGSAGFSLIELMVSITVGLIAVAGLVSVLMANRQAFNLQQGNNFNQENLRFATSRVAWSLRMSDFWGGVKPDSINSVASQDGLGGDGDCTAAWVLDVGADKQNGIHGYDGDDSFPLGDCVKEGNYVKGSDVLVLRYADTRGYDPDKGPGSVPFDSTAAGVVPDRTSVFLVSGVGQQATLFRGGQTVPTSPLGISTGRYVYPYQIEMYYLRPCSSPDAAGNCGGAGDDEATRSPTLVRMRMDDAGKLVSEDVVDGIEQLQFEYAGSNGQFVRASEADWPSVTQVRMTLVARAQSRDTQIAHDGEFTLSGHCAYKISASGQVSDLPVTDGENVCAGAPASNYGTHPQQFVRTVSTQIVVLRNRVRG